MSLQALFDEVKEKERKSFEDTDVVFLAEKHKFVKTVSLVIKNYTSKRMYQERNQYFLNPIGV